MDSDPNGHRQPSIREQATLASDAERERTVTLLKQHLVDGRLTSEEFFERMDQAYLARTRGELHELLRDLPAPPESGAPAPAAEAWWRRGPLLPVVGVVLLGLLLVGALAFGDGHRHGFFPFFPLWPLLWWWLFWGRWARSGRRRFPAGRGRT